MSATNRGAERLERDGYQTPLWAVHAILPYFQWDKVGTFLEPCKGDGHIYNSLPRGIKKYWREIEAGRDYLNWTPKQEFDLIITNPPYSLALEFLTKSLTEAKTVAYLLRLNYKGSIDRAAFWMLNPQDYELTLYPRPSFIQGGTDATEYAWIIWDRAGLVIPGVPPMFPITHESAPAKKKPLPSRIYLPPSMDRRQEDRVERKKKRIRRT